MDRLTEADSGYERRDRAERRDRRRSRSRSRSPRGRGSRGDRGSGERMVHISNIPFDVTWMELKDLLREKVGDPSFVEILTSRDGRSKGAAIVQFRAHADVQKCCDTMMDMKGRNLKCNEIRDPPAFFRKVKDETGKDFLGMSERPRDRDRADNHRPLASGSYDIFGLSIDFLRSHNIEPPLCPRVFVANVCFFSSGCLSLDERRLQLSYNVQSGKIHDIFSMAGKVTWVDMQVDKDGKNKGLCIVEFSHPLEAVQAVTMFDKQVLYDRRVAVKMDKFEAEHVRSRPGQLPEGLRSVGQGLGEGGRPLSHQEIEARVNPRPYAPSSMPAMDSYNATMPMDGIDSGRGFAHSGPMSAYSAPTIQQSFPPQGGGGGYQAQMQGGMGAQPTNPLAPSMAGVPPPQQSGYDARVGASGAQFLERGPPVAPSANATRTLIIRNLPPDYTWQMVKERLMRMGEVEFCDIVQPGVARVTFRNVATAERVNAALQGSVVEGRQIIVVYD